MTAPLTGREILDAAADRLQWLARSHQVTADTPGCLDRDLHLQHVALLDGAANAIRFVQSRGMIKLEDRPKDKKDNTKPSWASDITHRIDQEYAALFAGAFRAAVTDTPTKGAVNARADSGVESLDDGGVGQHAA